MDHDDQHAPSAIPQVELAAEIVPPELAHYPLEQLKAALLEPARQ